MIFWLFDPSVQESGKTLQHLICNAHRLTHIRFRLFPVRSPLLRESLLFSFPRVTKMFQFSRFALISYVFRYKFIDINRWGFPHSEISGLKPVCGSPKLIAAYHVLHRLWRQGIHRTPLLAWPKIFQWKISSLLFEIVCNLTLHYLVVKDQIYQL